MLVVCVPLFLLLWLPRCLLSRSLLRSPCASQKIEIGIKSVDRGSVAASVDCDQLSAPATGTKWGLKSGRNEVRMTVTACADRHSLVVESTQMGSRRAELDRFTVVQLPSDTIDKIKQSRIVPGLGICESARTA